jgi:hypothetical protein
MAALAGATMARPKKLPKSQAVRLTEEAMRLARIASGYTGESMAEYVSRIVEERSQQDIDRLHGEFKKAKQSPTKGER